jgi:hypothetical protein
MEINESAPSPVADIFINLGQKINSRKCNGEKFDPKATNLFFGGQRPLVPLLLLGTPFFRLLLSCPRPYL